MTNLYIEPDAEAELENAAVRYEQSVGGLGTQFLAEMRQRVRDIVAAPLSFPAFVTSSTFGALTPSGASPTWSSTSSATTRCTSLPSCTRGSDQGIGRVECPDRRALLAAPRYLEGRVP